ncbi:MAG: hypothetical protein COA36_12510 [Desulfotalea sp.]|nr:MAG: hypothetical protein COA36_12510 [Desulfotalea sp.]
MKYLITSLLLIGLTVSVAQADWLDDFTNSYKTENIDKAVDNAIQDGITPNLIVEHGLTITTINPQNIVKALYCAGVSGEDIYTAAQNNNISTLIITAGFQKSTVECGDKVADTQAYTPAGRQGRGFGGTDSGPRGRLFASPSTF